MNRREDPAWECAGTKTSGLTLKEAIESGRIFKRPNQYNWLKVEENKTLVYSEDCKFWYPIFLTLADILATDYELILIEEKKIELTRIQVEKIFWSSISKHTNIFDGFKDFLEELGFSE